MTMSLNVPSFIGLALGNRCLGVAISGYSWWFLVVLHLGNSGALCSSRHYVHFHSNFLMVSLSEAISSIFTTAEFIHISYFHIVYHFLRADIQKPRNLTSCTVL